MFKYIVKMKILLIEYDIINFMSRQDKIVKTSIIGIVVNLILVAFKATIGILVNSIAITLDAVNNLTHQSLQLLEQNWLEGHLIKITHMDMVELNIFHP